MVDVDVPLASGDAQTAHVIGNPQARVCVVLATFEVGVERLRHDAHGAVGRVHDDIHGRKHVRVMASPAIKTQRLPMSGASMDMSR